MSDSPDAGSPPGFRAPSADVSCRVAWADDAAAIADVQRRAWRELYDSVLPDELLTQMESADLEGIWLQSLTRPEDARQRVLVALAHSTVTGFALCSPATDPDSDQVADGEISELTVDPQRRREGHGSRLMQACVDTLRADRFQRALTWVRTTDDELRGFLTEAGWGPDGAHRTLDLTGDGSVQVKQVRLHTALA